MSTPDNSNAAGTTFAPAVPMRFDSLDIEFHGINIELESHVSGNLREVATNVVGSVLGNGWLVEATDEPREFDVTHSSKTPPDFKVRQYWEFCVLLEARGEIAFARPDFDLPSYTGAHWMGQSTSTGGVVPLKGDGIEFDDERTLDREWPLKLCKVPEAWQLIRNAGRLPGEGILIGHPDTGYRTHSEMDADRIHTGYQWDFVNHDNDPKSNNGLHGLGTASIIMSGEGGGMKGPALHSRIVPMRVTRTRFLKPAVVLFPFNNYKQLRRSLVYAQDRNFDVISISLGGPRKSYRAKVRKRIRKLNNQGAIVVAAAGNRQKVAGFTYNRVVHPARFPETIAVAASTVERTTWNGSSRGNTVDISAPGDSVWRAMYSGSQAGVERGSGTSFSTALVAGIAALWKSYRATELATVDQSRLYAIFRQLLKSTAQTDHQLLSNTGAGIVDAHALLNADIPAESAIIGDPPAVDAPLREISAELGDMRRHFNSLTSIADRSLAGLNDLELDELENALEMEKWYAIVNSLFDRRSIVQELSQTLSNKLSAGN